MKNNKRIAGFIAALVMVTGFITGVANAQTPEENYAAAKTAYQNEVNAYKTAREQFLTAQSNYLKLKNATNKKAYEDQARVYLGKTVDVLIKRLEAIKVWVSDRRAISETEKQAIITEIEKDISTLEGMKSGIDTATPVQIISKAKEIRAYWAKHRVFVKRITGQVWSARVNYVIDQAEIVSAKVDATIQELKAAGKDTAELEAWLVDFDQKIAAAKEKNEIAKIKFQAIDSLADMDQFFREGHQFVLDAGSYIRSAHAKLIEIIKEIKATAKTIETTTPEQ